MNKAEAWSHFPENYAKEYCAAQIMDLEREFSLRVNELASEFLEPFREICRNIYKMQQRNPKGKIACIYSMLRTTLLDRQLVYLIEAFNHEWYMDFTECQALSLL